MWKNVLLTIVISLWLIFIGYSASCLVAYLVGWPPYVAPLICAAISLLVIIPGLFLRKIKNVTAIFFVVFISLFLSSSANMAILRVIFMENTYRGGVIEGYYNHFFDACRLYNILGYKVSSIPDEGICQYEYDCIYVMTPSKVYTINYMGELLDEKDWILIDDYSDRTDNPYSIKFIQHPFTQKKYLYVDWENFCDLWKTNEYESIEYYGVDDNKNSYIGGYKEGHGDIVKIETSGYVRIIKEKCREIYKGDELGINRRGYLFLFVVKEAMSNSYIFIDLKGCKIQTPHERYRDYYIKKVGYGKEGIVYYDCCPREMNKRALIWINENGKEADATLLEDYSYIKETFSEYDPIDDCDYICYIIFKRWSYGSDNLYDIREGLLWASFGGDIIREAHSGRFYYIERGVKWYCDIK